MKWAVRLALAALFALGALLAAAWLTLRASLPQLDGTIAAAALSAPVSIERDALGVVTIRGASRADVAFATGFVHAQDRFFQMDLSRRLAGGAISGLFGELAAEADARAAAFGFRTLAREVLAQAPDGEREVIAAYTRGVNRGLESLGSRPWEYWLLRRAPDEWRDEDTVLVAYSMWWDLQYGDWEREIVLRSLDARLGGPVCASGWKCATEFFYPARNPWDAPNEEKTPLPIASLAPIPPPEAIDLRRAPVDAAALRAAARATTRDVLPGSNNWALSGALTSSGAALVANDMHLNSRVPAVWYRARLIVEGEGAGPALELNGVMLPGTPALVAGSNGRIAWGFTNSYGDWQDVALHSCDAQDAGVRVAADEGGRCWFTRWLAQVPEATNFRILDLERATSVDEALALAPEIGIPHNNFVVGDRDGRIGWAIAGRIPRASGDARTAARDGWLGADEAPRIVDPESGRLWTANALPSADPVHQRLLGDDEAAIGSGYDLGARALQIRNGLFAIERGATPRDMLRVQLDDTSLLIARWRTLALALLDEAALQGHPERAEFRRLVAEGESRAAADAVGYRLLRAWHGEVERTVWAMLLTALDIPLERARVHPRFEAPLWRLLTEQPAHLLARGYPSWRALLLEALDASIVELRAQCGALAGCTWGAARPVRVRHPLSRAVPALSRFIDMPTVELPGDADLPRVQQGAFGASQRMAVSPGDEQEGYLHFPGGQSGHPSSPFYRSHFDAWAGGEPLPLLPGEPRHRLTLGALD